MKEEYNEEPLPADDETLMLIALSEAIGNLHLLMAQNRKERK